MSVDFSMKPVSGLSFKEPIVMGILNVTPDSFSDGGRFLDLDDAVAHGMLLATEGASIIDVGGESTRPGSERVAEDEEKRRVLPVIEKLAELTDAIISVDTVKPGVAREAVLAGASMINDVSTLRGGKALAEVAAEAGATLVIMHSRGTPADMQRRTSYGDVVAEVIAELKRSVDVARRAGVAKEQIWLDPGIGFAKTVSQNLALLKHIDRLVDLGYPVLVGPSRKSFIGQLTGADVSERLGGTLAAVTAAILKGARAVRVHDVATARQAVLVAQAIAEAGVTAEHGKAAGHA